MSEQVAVALSGSSSCRVVDNELLALTLKLKAPGGADVDRRARVSSGTRGPRTGSVAVSPV